MVIIYHLNLPKYRVDFQEYILVVLFTIDVAERSQSVKTQPKRFDAAQD
jgi:hypothetical protein